MPLSARQVLMKYFWNERARSPPVCEIFAYKNPILLRVISDIFPVNAPVAERVMGILLYPVGRFRTVVIDVVSERLLHASHKMRSFAEKTGVVPVFVECHSIRYAHREHNVIDAITFF